MKPIKLLVCFSDLHCGSTVGLMRPGFVTREGNTVKANPIQRWLWDCWRRGEDMVYRVVGNDAFALQLNGDLVEGCHHGTKQVISPDPADHVNAAEEILAPYAKAAAKAFVVKGTECHTGGHELTLGTILGGQIDPDSHDKKPVRAFDRLSLSVHGTRCAFSHHIGTSIRSYMEASQLGIALTEELVAAATNREPEPRVVVRSHRHRFGFFGNGHSLCFVTPPWQALTRFGHKVVPVARCHPGVLILDWRDRKPGSLPQFHYQTYEAPQATCITV